MHRPLDHADPVLDVLHERGLEHERRYLAGLEDAGLAVTTITPDGGIEDAGGRPHAPGAAVQADGLSCMALRALLWLLPHGGRTHE